MIEKQDYFYLSILVGLDAIVATFLVNNTTFSCPSECGLTMHIILILMHLTLDTHLI